MCLKDRVLKNPEGNKLRSQIADSLKNLHANLESLVTIREKDMENDSYHVPIKVPVKRNCQ